MRKKVMHWVKQDQNKGNMLPAFSSLTSHWSVFLFSFSPLPSPLPSPHLHTITVISAEHAPLPQSVTQPQPLTLLLPDSTLIPICSTYTTSWISVASVNHPDGIQKPTCVDLYTMKCACSTTGRNRFRILKYIFYNVARITPSARHEKLTWVNVYSEKYLIWKLKTKCMLAHTDTSKQLNTANNNNSIVQFWAKNRRTHPKW